ncbi:MAG: hypothetical protein IJS46_06470, partial [Kiritimatiellae bacterium]|nr:hypothetical protein [Kiritimatiellia bacterium]
MKIAATFEAAALTALIASAVSATASGRPETAAFPFRESIAAGGTYAAGSTAGTNFVVSGSIS